MVLRKLMPDSKTHLTLRHYNARKCLIPGREWGGWASSPLSRLQKTNKTIMKTRREAMESEGEHFDSGLEFSHTL